jgi:mevalonate kinase
MFYDFQTTTHGKWILAGEHAVLREYGALVFPVLEKTLTLSHKNNNTAFSVEYEGENSNDIHLLFRQVLEQGQHLLGKSLHDLRGYFHLNNNIPIGTGMGASAALCVAVARWFAAQGDLNPESIHLFATDLENLFHGKSSGLDTVGVSAHAGLYFEKGRTIAIQQKWHPYWFLSSSGQVGITSHCIKQVQELWHRDPITATRIDAAMNASVHDALNALETHDSFSLQRLAQGINQAATCFKQWGLTSEYLQQHMQKLMDAGAIAVKPTGSGGGGYVLSLWKEKPQGLPIDFIEI